MNSTRSLILKLLSTRQDYVSGEEMSRLAGVSRAAVNQAVKSLRNEGYEIASVTNRGYLLVSSPDLISDAELALCLDEERMELVFVFSRIDSTNRELARRAPAGALDRTVVVANEQTGGLGRRGRSFISQPGAGIYLSYLVRPSAALREKIAAAEDSLIWAGLTSFAAVAMADAVERVSGVRPGIKWVNDLYINDRKIAGILTQSVSSAELGEIEYIVIGIGINVCQDRSDFPEEIRERAGSLWSETGRRVRRSELTAQMVLSLDRMLDDWPDCSEKYLRKYRDDSIVIGREVSILGPASAEDVLAVRIDDDFALVVKGADGREKRLISGDISLRL